MFAVKVEEPEIEPEPQIELKIHPSLLLKVRYFSLVKKSCKLLLDPMMICLKTLIFALILYLQPTDVPQHVIDEKKLNITSNKEKEESSNKSNSLSLQHVEQLQQEQQEKEQQEQLV